MRQLKVKTAKRKIVLSHAHHPFVFRSLSVYCSRSLHSIELCVWIMFYYKREREKKRLITKTIQRWSRRSATVDSYFLVSIVLVGISRSTRSRTEIEILLLITCTPEGSFSFICFSFVQREKKSLVLSIQKTGFFPFPDTDWRTVRVSVPSSNIDRKTTPDEGSKLYLSLEERKASRVHQWKSRKKNISFGNGNTKREKRTPCACLFL